MAMIDLYTWGTPNGRKISIMLEACGFDYRIFPVNIGKREQFLPQFLALSPNNRIPAIVDHDGPDGNAISLFESGAILIYLANKGGRYLPDVSSDPAGHYQVQQWLMWQMGGFGPMLGQAHHFRRFAKEQVPYSIKRYSDESRRLWQVLDKQLTGREYVCDQLSIADFAIYPWAMRHEWQGIQWDEFPAVAQWAKGMGEYDFVKRGMAVPETL
ncbi:MAG: glutathione S-transferase N-terminal domain-containing protein [Motiliproteus sp.]|nr:glutathione S-transferase N-terminal domain-containing protein [Motiliproteus sp.]MCW9053816.1 glutathione S-transferase N-terminal domain-containing protein [Motiliproteus sp.]